VLSRSCRFPQTFRSSYPGSHRSAPTKDVSAELRELVHSAVRREIAISATLPELVRSAVQQEIRVSAELRELVGGVAREEMQAAAINYVSAEVYSSTCHEMEHLSSEVELLHAQLLKLTVKVDSLETRVSDTPKQDQESTTNMLVARTSHLANRMNQLMSFCTDISQQGDKLRSRLDAVTTHFNTAGRVSHATKQSFGETCSTLLLGKVEHEPPSGFATSRSMTPQAIPIHCDDFMADIDIPEEGSAHSKHEYRGFTSRPQNI